MDGRRRVVVVIFPDVEILDAVGPSGVLNTSDILQRTLHPDVPGGYSVELVAVRSGPIRTSGGIEIVAHTDFESLEGPIDTLLVAGGVGVRAAIRDGRVVEGVRRLAKSARRVCSVCTGALILAEAGLLEGKRAVTHWAYCDRFAEEYPDVHVEPDPIFVRDGNVYTSAGVTAGMDLALALVEDDLGHDLAITAARWMVLFLKRPGGQSQFSAQLERQTAEREPIRDLLVWIVEHVGEDLGVEALARRTAMSERNFARVFTREVGTTPARYVERVRVETARRSLERSVGSIDEIASGSGFGSAETMRRAFLRNLGVPPSAYRNRFAADAA